MTPTELLLSLGTGLVIGPYARRVAQIESDYTQRRARAIAASERSLRLISAARDRIGR